MPPQARGRWHRAVEKTLASQRDRPDDAGSPESPHSRSPDSATAASKCSSASTFASTTSCGVPAFKNSCTMHTALFPVSVKSSRHRTNSVAPLFVVPSPQLFLRNRRRPTRPSANRRRGTPH
eukprot:scaffold3870_cov246-Pinguiococcus_pyrenoidosus.AAC.2